MSFDPTISLGTILQTVLLSIAVGAIIARLAKMETKVDAMWRSFLKYNKWDDQE